MQLRCEFHCNLIHNRPKNKVDVAAKKSVTSIVGESTIDFIRDWYGQSLGVQARMNVGVVFYSWRVNSEYLKIQVSSKTCIKKKVTWCSSGILVNTDWDKTSNCIFACTVSSGERLVQHYLTYGKNCPYL